MSGGGPPPGRGAGGARREFPLSKKSLIGLAAMVLFLWLAFRRVPLGEFAGALAGARPLPILLAALAQVASHALRAWRWKILLHPADPGLRRRKAFAALMVGYAVNVLIPRGGEVARALYLNKIARTPLAAGLSSVVNDRLLDMASLALLFPLSLVFFQDRLENLFPGIGRAVLAAAGATVLGLAAVWALGRAPAPAAAFIGRLARRVWPSRAERIAGLTGGFLLGLAGLFRRESAGRMALLTAAIWVLYILSNGFLFAAIPLGTRTPLGAADAAVITLIVALAFTIPAPGGTGTVHFLVSRALIGLYAVPAAQAVAFATLVHGVGVAVALLLCAGCLLLSRPAPGAGGGEAPPAGD